MSKAQTQPVRDLEQERRTYERMFEQLSPAQRKYSEGKFLPEQRYEASARTTLAELKGDKGEDSQRQG